MIKKNKLKLMKTFKQRKYSILINKYLNKIFILENKNNFKNIFITVIYVYININYSYSNIYITIYPDIYKNKIYKNIKLKKKYYKKKLSFFLKKKFKIPELNFYLSNKKTLEFIYFTKNFF
ncbi:MAG: hypothetical protein NHF93_00295 [Candidatus Shikimatogenerans bostrichidophilus]|nr:MAG: hypothetical protein NHF93_00295 [Candidatus Shikimatogenerans bostrichidophilus]